MTFVTNEEVIQLDEGLLKGQLVVFAFILFVFREVFWHVFLAEHGHLLTTMSVEHCKQRVAVSQVQTMDVRVLV